MKITKENTIALLKKLSGFFYLRTDLEGCYRAIPRRFARAYNDIARQETVWVLAPFNWVLIFLIMADDAIQHRLKRRSFIDNLVRSRLDAFDPYEITLNGTQLATLWGGQTLRIAMHQLTIRPAENLKVPNKLALVMAHNVQLNAENGELKYRLGQQATHNVTRDALVKQLRGFIDELLALVMAESAMPDALGMTPAWKTEQVRAYIYTLRSRITDLVREARQVINEEVEFQNQRAERTGTGSFHDSLSRSINALTGSVAAAEEYVIKPAAEEGDFPL